MRKQLTEQQAWEQLYGRRTPDVRVLGKYGDEDEERRKRPAVRAEQGDSEAHAA